MTVMIDKTKGDRFVSVDEACTIIIPEETNTYSPVSNEALITMLSDKVVQTYGVSHDDIEFKLALAHEDQQLFGSMKVNSIADERFNSALSICFRNSYDKSLSVALAGGANCWICSNLQISGTIIELRRHTTNVWNTLDEMLGKVVTGANDDFRLSMMMADALDSIDLTEDNAYKTIGLALGRGILRPRQASVAFKELRAPTHEEFAPQNVWSLYNHFTEALKRGPAGEMLTRHERADRFFQNEFLN